MNSDDLQMNSNVKKEVAIALSTELKTECMDALNDNDLVVLKQTLERHPDIIKEPGYLNELLEFALESNVEIMEFLLEQGADIRQACDPPAPEGLAYYAAVEGNNEILKWVLEKGAHVNCIVDGRTRCFALSTAARKGNLEAIQLLVKHGADVNAFWDNRNALTEAIAFRHTKVVEYLRSVGAKTPHEQET